MKTLKIAKGIDLPLDIVTQTIAILAKRRAGKSYTMRKLVEQLFEAAQQVILVDPKGDQWGIRSSVDGKKPGFPIVILGGEHGDAPLEVNAGEVVAKLVVEERVSILLDLSTFRKHEVATFMTAFLENLYRLKAREEYRTPVMLVVDEADAIAPQKPQKGEERMLGAAEDIVRRGGQRGIGCALITQRSAVLNKNVLTQAQMLIVLRTIAPQDLAAMKAWIDVHGSEEEGGMLMESLPSLPIGDAWFWSPGWPTAEGIFIRSHVLPIETFDSGATPAPGEKKIVPKNLADVDLDALKKQMSATIERAKNDDPKILKKKIAELEQQNTTLLKNPFQKDLTKEDVEPYLKELQKKHDAQMLALTDEYLKQVNNWFKILKGIGESMESYQTKKPKYFKKIQQVIKPIVPAMTPRIEAFASLVDSNTQDKTFGRCSKAIYSYLNSKGNDPMTYTQIAVAIGYSKNSGGFNNSLSELSATGIIGRGVGKAWLLKEVSDLQIVIDTSLEKWSSKLGACSRAIWEYLLGGQLENEYQKDEIAQATNYSVSSGGFNNSLSELSALGLIERVPGGMVRINPEILDL